LYADLRLPVSGTSVVKSAPYITKLYKAAFTAYQVINSV